jgi:hypothetical protein
MGTWTVVGIVLAVFAAMFGFVASRISLANSLKKDEQISWNRYYLVAALFLLLGYGVDKYAGSEDTRLTQKKVDTVISGQDEIKVGVKGTGDAMAAAIEGQRKSNESVLMDTKEIKVMLAEALRAAEDSHEAELRKQFPFGYFVFGTTDEVFQHLEFRPAIDKVTVSTNADWTPTRLEVKNGRAIIDFDGLLFDFKKNGMATLKGVNVPAHFDIPLIDGHTQEVRMVLVSEFYIVLQVLDKNSVAPIFAIGFKQGANTGNQAIITTY